MLCYQGQHVQDIVHAAIQVGVVLVLERRALAGKRRELLQSSQEVVFDVFQVVRYLDSNVAVVDQVPIEKAFQTFKPLVKLLHCFWKAFSIGT